MSEHVILIVDDNPENLTVLGEMLRPHYRVLVATSGERALALASAQPMPDLILLDVMMPGMNGFQVLAALQSGEDTRHIPVIFTTAMRTTEAEERGLKLGAADYITKPLRPAIVLARVHAHLELKLAQDRLRQDKACLETEMARQHAENQAIGDVAMRALARLAQTRDNETGNHLLRTQAYVEALAGLAARLPQHEHTLDDHTISLITKSAALHDIGKVGIPDRILLKKGKLSADEWAVMKTHARQGAEALERAVADIRPAPGFLIHAIQIARHHHERWDGAGYPDGLAGEAIPLSARLMAIADVFDALISRRVYKEPMHFEKARDIMARQRGLHFDPVLLDLFLANFPLFCAIAARHPDEEARDEAHAPVDAVTPA